jgi:hypothetical protein
VTLAHGYPRLERGARATIELKLQSVAKRSSARACWQLNDLHSAEPITGATLNEAPVGLEGGSEVALTDQSRSGWSSSGCAVASPVVLAEIFRQPTGFYLQLNTNRHPYGALRGQL